MKSPLHTRKSCIHTKNIPIHLQKSHTCTQTASERCIHTYKKPSVHQKEPYTHEKYPEHLQKSNTCTQIASKRCITHIKSPLYTKKTCTHE